MSPPAQATAAPSAPGEAPEHARDRIQGHLGYRFADPALLEIALTHSSHAHERGGEDNERLEFLGDAVLQMCTTLLLMEHFPRAREGELSRLRARLVNTRALASLAREIELGTALRLGVGEEATGGRTRTSNLANAIEAVLGAIHVDGGLAPADAVVRGWMRPRLDQLSTTEAPSGERWKDPVSRLQEWMQATRRTTPRYEVLATEGPPHERVFQVAVTLEGEIVATGTGRSKKEASRAAADAALLALGHEEVS